MGILDRVDSLTQSQRVLVLLLLPDILGAASGYILLPLILPLSAPEGGMYGFITGAVIGTILVFILQRINL